MERTMDWCRIVLQVEEDTIMCAPLQTSNGKWVNEVIPHTSNFQIFLKFTNVTEGDVVLLDDLSVKFTPCLTPARITPQVNEKAPSSRRKSQPANSPKKFVSERRVAEISQVMRDTENLKKRFCKEGDCTTIVHHSSNPSIPRDRMCIGRVGLLQCREKCLNDGAESATARCVRQHEFPFQKRCLCQVRRSPVHKVDGGRLGAKLQNSTEKPFKRALPEPRKEKWQEMQLVGGEARLSDEPCAKENGDELCDRKCISQDMNSSGRCQAENDHVVCRCLPCSMSVCDFEKDTECGWTDMRMIDQRFGNVSIASKRDQKNRYGLSRVASESHSGLYRHGPFEGPITLSVDVYPTEGIDVRICVDTLQKCQTQKVTPKSWNRVRAKIKVKRADRIFLLFFNMSDEDRAMAMDNISLKSGRCASFT
ncbi:unnamed protein product [Cylicocyclus nassatus]|uniref:Uncharacterized protein n=1 Tax=Cylicocyclus nassatus TaxID=53992 RepID=A0AA36H0C4_CYLNA|nr:unnamed protein product [Cylicocyclus nassatus]